LVGGIDRVNRIGVVLKKRDVQILELDGVFALESPLDEGVKHLSHVRIAVRSGFPEFDRLADDRRVRVRPSTEQVSEESTEFAVQMQEKNRVLSGIPNSVFARLHEMLPN
jgi:hypothetical protein